MRIQRDLLWILKIRLCRIGTFILNTIIFIISNFTISTFPFVKRLVKLPPNIVFDLVGIVGRINSGMKAMEKSFFQLAMKLGKTKLV